METLKNLLANSLINQDEFDSNRNEIIDKL